MFYIYLQLLFEVFKISFNEWYFLLIIISFYPDRYKLKQLYIDYSAHKLDYIYPVSNGNIVLHGSGIKSRESRKWGECQSGTTTT